jgi:hypothetical protein
MKTKKRRRRKPVRPSSVYCHRDLPGEEEFSQDLADLLRVYRVVPDAEWILRHEVLASDLKSFKQYNWRWRA